MWDALEISGKEATAGTALTSHNVIRLGRMNAVRLPTQRYNGRTMRRISVPLLAAIALCSTHAQLSAPLPDEMKSLEGLIGEWTGTMKMAPMPGSTETMDVATTVSVKMHGVFQETIYVMDLGPLGKLTGHMFLTWDSTDKSYKSWSFDDNANTPRTEKGTWDGKRLVMTSDPHGGMVSRITFEPRSKDEVYFLVEMKNGEKFEKMGDVVYKRKFH